MQNIEMDKGKIFSAKTGTTLNINSEQLNVRVLDDKGACITSRKIGITKSYEAQATDDFKWVEEVLHRKFLVINEESTNSVWLTDDKHIPLTKKEDFN